MADNIEKKKVIVEVEVQADEAKLKRVEKNLDKIEKKAKRKIKRPIGDITGAGWADYIPYNMRGIHKKRFEEQRRGSLISDRNRRLTDNFSDAMWRLRINTKSPLMKEYGNVYYGFNKKITGLRLKPSNYSNVKYATLGHKKIWEQLRNFYQREREEKTSMIASANAMLNFIEDPAENYLSKKNKGFFSRFRRPKISTMNTFKDGELPQPYVRKAPNIRVASTSHSVDFGKYQGVNRKRYNTELDYYNKIHSQRQKALEDAFSNFDAKHFSETGLFRHSGMSNNTAKEINKNIDNAIKKNVQSKLKRIGGTNRQSRSYMDSNFQRNMMYLGSAMLINYAVQMVGRSVATTLSATANTEVASLQGRAFRNDLIKRGENVGQFDLATSEYSRLSGTAEYASRAKMANLFGRLRGAGINTNALNGRQLVQTMRGLELYTGDTPEQVDKKLFDLLSGKAEKSTRKEFGVTATNNPTEILKQIHQTLLRNPVASIGMNQSLLKDTLNKIVQAPNKMLDNVHSRFPEIFYDIGESISEFTDGFFGNLDPDVEKRWIALFGTMRSFIDQIVTAESGGTVAKFLTDTVGVFFANLRDTAIAVNKGIDYINKEDTVGNKVFNVGKFLWDSNRYLRDPFSMYRDAMNWYNDKPNMPLATPYGGSYLTGGAPTNVINGNNIYIDGAGVKIDSKLNEVTY